MTEKLIEKSADKAGESFASFIAPAEMSYTESASARFTVSGFKRVPQRFFPTIVVCAALVLLATLMFVAGIFGK